MTERELFFKYLGLPSFHPLGLEIEKAEGIYLYDKSGKRFIDLVSGISVSNIGHRHPAVIKAIQDQLEKYLYLNVYGEFIQSPQVKLAARLTDLLPGHLNSVFLVNSGSEAVEGALKLAKRFTGRTELVSFRNSYHGSTQGALSILGNEYLKDAFRPLIPDTRIIGFNNFSELDQITDRTACVVAETIQAEAGIILPKDGFLLQLRKRCSETGTLLIIDDVQMGFGRTGKMFSFEHYGIIPDILVLAKALGGGMPVGAFIAPKEIMSTLAYQPELGHITTSGGHPVSCVAALASLEVLMQANLFDDAGTGGQNDKAGIPKTEYKGWRIEKRIIEHSLVREVRRKGLMLGVEINQPGARKKLTERCLENGLIIDWFMFKPDTFRIAPPLTITADEIDLSCDLLLKSMGEL